MDLEQYYRVVNYLEAWIKLTVAYSFVAHSKTAKADLAIGVSNSNIGQFEQ